MRTQKPGCWQLLVRKVPKISLDSVTMRLRCGLMFSSDFILNLLLSLMMKEFENQLLIGRVTGSDVPRISFWGYKIAREDPP